MSLRGRVLAATDLSAAGDEAVRQAVSLATDLGVRLVVCHVLPDVSAVRMLFPQDAGPDPRVHEELERKARAALRQRVEAATGQILPDESLLVEFGTPHAGILTAAERMGAGVIVLGPGGTAVRVAHHTSGAVLVARASPSGGDVLGATDFSDPALPAVSTAVEEAARRGVGLRLMHCLDLDIHAVLAMAGPLMMPPMPSGLEARMEADARARLTECFDRFGASGEALVTGGPAASQIMQAAAKVGASLVVVGTRGRTGVTRLLLGSVAEAVARSAPCSVLIVPLQEVSSSVAA